MARVIPGGPPDYTTQVAMREAAANDALTRLYISLAKRKEERLQQQEFLKQMLELKHGYTEKLYDKYGAPGARGGNPNFQQWQPPVVGDEDNPLADKGGATTDAAAPPAQQQRPYVGPNPDAFTKPPGPQSQLPVDKISEAATAMAQAPGKGETTTLSAQSLLAKPPASMKTTGTRSAAARKEGFRDIGPKTLAAWADAEKRNGLQPGTLLVVLGIENAGGWTLGANPRSRGGASGLFQSTPEWRRDFKVSEADQNNPVVMGDAVAAGIARNRAGMEKMTGRKFGDTPKDMAWMHVAWQWGAGNAPRIAHAYNAKPDAPMWSVIMPSRAKDGSTVSPKDTLANNGIPLDMSVKTYIETKVYPKVQDWHSKALVKLQEPPSQTAAIPRNTTGVPTGAPTATVPQGANFAGRGAGAQYRFGDTANMVAVPIPDGSGRTVVVHKDVAPIAHGFLKDMHAAGAPLTSISGYVPKNIKGSRTASQHGFGFAIDMSQQGRNQVSKEYRDWAIANKNTLGQILAKWQIRSGGDWRNPDFGHIEFGPEALAAYKNRQAQPKAVATAAPPIPPTKPADYDKAGAGPFMGVVAGEKAKASPSLIAQPNVFFDPSMRKPITGTAAAIAGTSAQPSNAPPAAIKNVPPESSAAAAAPTPQTQQPIEQKTQAVEAPTPQQVREDQSLTDSLDPNDTAATRLSGSRGVFKGVSDVIGDIGWAAGDIADKAGKIGTNLAETRYTDPQYRESEQGFDEAGMEGVQNYVTPEAVPGQAIGAIKGGVNNIIQSIQNKAREYNELQASRNDSRQLEQMYNYPRPETPQGAPSSSPSRNLFGQQTPIEMPYSSGAAQAATPQQAPQPQLEQPPDPNNFSDPRNVQRAQEILGRIHAQRAGVEQQMPPQERGDVGRGAGPSPNFPFDPNTEGVPSYGSMPQPSIPPPAAPQAAPSLPVPASTVADAMYGTGAELPSYEQIPHGGGLDWIKNLFTSKQDTSPVKAKPVKTQGIRLTPGGAPYIPNQPPLNLQSGGTPMQVAPQGGDAAQGQTGQIIMQYDENGNPMLKMVE